MRVSMHVLRIARRVVTHAARPASFAARIRSGSDWWPPKCGRQGHRASGEQLAHLTLLGNLMCSAWTASGA